MSLKLSIRRSPTPTLVKITSVTEPIQHAEGPHWNPILQSLLFVDTFSATVYQWHHTTRKITSFKLENHDSVGVIIPIHNETNRYIVGADRTLYKLNWSESEGADLKKLSEVDVDKPRNQFNDGKADQKGRLWIGTLTRNEDLSVTPNGGSFFKITGSKLEKIDEKLTNISISNGLEWSSDNKNFYYIDSLTKSICSFDFDNETGDISNRKTLFDLKEYPELEGIPDGMTIDSDNNLWVALFGGHHILHINSRTGKLIRKIPMPVTYLTSACFGGPNMDILYVTSSRLHLDDESLKKEPRAGSIFSVENLGVSGVKCRNIILSK